MAEPIHGDTVHFLTSPINDEIDKTRPKRAHDDPHPPPSIPTNINTTTKRNIIKFVVVSDTHSHPDWIKRVPDGDVFIHCGDLTRAGTPAQLKTVYEEIKALPHKIKIIVAGNHDLGLDPSFLNRHAQQLAKLETGLTSAVGHQLRRMWKSRDATGSGILFLEHEHVNVRIKGRNFQVFGSPWTPEFCDWAFMYPLDQNVWSPSSSSADCRPVIPDTPQTADEDLIWITHGPPKGTLDQVLGIGSVGCPFLAEEIARLCPTLHCFGHIHEGASVGMVEVKHPSGKVTKSINAAMLDEKYRLAYPATVLYL